MANETVNDLPAKSGALAGTEIVEIDDGSSKRVTAQQIADLAIAADVGITVNEQTGTTYTLQASDNGGAVEMTNASANTVTVPSGLADGFNCLITQMGAGQTTVAQGSGATVRNPNATAKVRAQYRSLTIRRAKAASTYILDGYTADN